MYACGIDFLTFQQFWKQFLAAIGIGPKNFAKQKSYWAFLKIIKKPKAFKSRLIWLHLCPCLSVIALIRLFPILGCFPKLRMLLGLRSQSWRKEIQILLMRALECFINKIISSFNWICFTHKYLYSILTEAGYGRHLSFGLFRTNIIYTY